jgi:dephospho-CoA kinase
MAEVRGAVERSTAMILVGLTGGIGSGKTTVARRFAELGCPVVDADAIARQIVAVGEPTLEELAEHFGASILQDDGSLDRAALAAIAFADDESRRHLDRLTHPRIAARIAQRVAELAPDHPDGVVVVDHPLLVETSQAGRFDAVVVVLAPEELRVRRLVTDRGMDADDVRARLRSQADDAARRAVATHVLVNDGPLERLLPQVDEVHRQLAQRAAQDPAG